MKEIIMWDFDYKNAPAPLLTPEIVQMIGSIHEHKGKQLYPNISKVTMERTLTELLKAGYIEKVGAGPSTSYVRK